MPRAFDRKTLTTLYDPTRSGTDFHRPASQSIMDVWGDIIKQSWENFEKQLLEVTEKLLPGSTVFIEALLGSDPFANLLGILGNPNIFDPDFDLEQAVTDFFAKVFDQTAFQNLLKMLGVPDITNPDFDLTQAVIDFINLIIKPTGLVLHHDSPLNSLNLFNLVPTDLMGHISASAIGTAVTNLITDPTFADAAHFTGGGIYEYDAAEGHAGVGSARTVADGTGSKDLLSNLIAVSEGQVLPISGWAKWTGLAAAAGTFPVQLCVTGYVTGSDVTQQTIIAKRNNTPPTTDWTYLSGLYTVPADVTGIRVRLTVTPAATAGTVWWDDLSATKTGPMLQRLIAGTDPGDVLSDDIENLFTGIVTNAQALITKVEQEAHDALVDIIGGTFGNDLAAAEARLNDFLHSLSTLNADNINAGEISDQFVPGLSTIHDVIVKGVGNLSGSGFSIDKAWEVLTGQTNSVVSSTTGLVNVHSRLSTAESRLAALPVSLGGTGVGISYGGIVGCSDTDEFERVSSTSLGAGWLQYYSAGGGVWATPNGHDAEYMWSGTSDREFICIRNNASLPRSLTDYQRVTNVLSSKGTRHYDSALGTYNYVGHNDVLLRVSDSTTSLSNMTLIRIRWGADGGLSIVRFVNGVATTLKSYPTGTYTPPGPGAALIGEAGDIDGGDVGVRYFRGIIGNSVAIEVTEQGVASGCGAAFRRWGHGGRVEGWQGLFDNGQERPGTLHHWSAMDQVFT